ncbi:MULTISPECIES: ATP-binding cassette domain-containing protein [unclassified Nocardia]|uniref:ATP-binding cassette domain-containing protein n=1 Tax=unclassified Nocardia TaxID=2637762 RepID=UPI001CE3BC46|nr:MULTISPECIES: ATP-binding cassette domain-containing protein [unclassified Nocardia]
MSTRRPAITVCGLTKRFATASAVENVGFTVSEGTTAALVGPAGSGKTTVLRLLLGLIEPTSGTTTLDGVAHGMLTPRGLHPARTARDHLRVYAAAAGIPDERVEQVLGQVGLGEVADTKAGALSPGEQTRVALATALLGDPRLLLLDEPTAGLDPAERGQLQDLLRRHTARGGTVLLTSESLAAVLPGADQLIVLSAGSIVYQGTPARLRRGHPDRLVVTASTPIALATMLAARGYTDSVMRPDGRLAVAEATAAQIEDAAAAAGVRIDGIVADQIHPDRVLAALTKPANPPVVSGLATPYGIPR